MKAKNKSWFEMIFSSLISSIVGYFFLSVLIGSTIFLLFDYNTELIKIKANLIDLKQNANNLTPACELCKTFNNSWFFKNKGENITKAHDIYSELLNNPDKKSLDSTFSDNAISFCDSSRIALELEKGSISGYVVTGDSFKAHQQAILTLYDQQITMLSQLEDMISKWTSESSTDKLKYMDAINQSDAKILASINTIKNILPTMTADTNLEQEKANQIYEEANNSYTITQVKYYLSIIGLLISIVLFIMGIRASKAYFSLKAKKKTI